MLLRPVALVLLVYRVWRRVPASQRRRLVSAAQREGARLLWRHGPRIAGALLGRTTRRR
ncbi:MAG: hypothetical protein KatS3mg012_0585 [Gaiellaceae bacterium]|nr:MAG: hypothetical protein KatS3mg012_0585 [Gaiellaceae bacterium]